MRMRAKRPFRTGFLLLLITMSGLGACSRATPLCAYGDALAKQANLTQASDAYAQAQRNDEGDCADDGLEEVADDMAAARAGDAKGRAALRAGDTAAAKAAFESSLKIDRGDPVAIVELQRIGSTVPSAAPTPPPLVVTAARPSGTLAWTGITIALVMSILTAVAWWRLRRHVRAVDERWERSDRNREYKYDRASRPLDDASSQLRDLTEQLKQARTRQDQLDGKIGTFATEVSEVRSALSQLTTISTRQKAALGGTMRDTASLRAELKAVAAESALQRRQLETLASLMIDGRPRFRTERFGPKPKLEDDRD
ncbi:hypothetical protein [Paractinoplanes lichenicola]|uniref:Tetratricopeptide repeat protein n=1 Tax=Paractinoplanes lichenicola TaxID=2802976 RepID=A0ABS1VF18_9ACTN|nr:hypothetical protein [Actinoplanes lichenicola]MBL7253263.1 hypothetical protein [Actinoplanes lichenicola]